MKPAKVILNENERQILDLLCGYCKELNVKRTEPVELRITGGWVRDKLLGKESNDVDVAVNVMTGEEFATGLLLWAQTKQIDLGANSTSLHTIKKNPEKSKHLETCTTKIFSLDIDFVNLRSEQYTNDSRVPIIECGTAEEDALRRDATLNALFYNLNKEEIEDFTGRGLEDLANGVLRTPLQPKQTFLDDPLRVLRLIRFACRFNFTVEPDTFAAMAQQDVAEALAHKISRERIGVEMDKILTCDNVQYGLDLIQKSGLLPVIFSIGPLQKTALELTSKDHIDHIEQAHTVFSAHVARLCASVAPFVSALTEGPLADLAKSVLLEKATAKVFWETLILAPFRGIYVTTNPKKAVPTSYVELILKEGLRFGKQDYYTASNILYRNQEVLHACLSGSEVPRSRLGLYIREFDDHFPVNVLQNAFIDYLQRAQLDFDQEAFKSTVSAYNQFLGHVLSESLMDVAHLKPLVDGKMIAKALDKKPGPWMKSVTEDVLTWQLDHPNGTAEECLAYLGGHY